MSMTYISNEQISNNSHINENESLSINPASTQIVKYNPNSTFQNLLEEAQPIYYNEIIDST